MSKILIDEAVVRNAQMYFNMIATGDNLDWIKHQAGEQAEALRQALEQPVAQIDTSPERVEKEAGNKHIAAPAQEPVADRENAIIRFALHQFMSKAYSHMNAAAQDKDGRRYPLGAVEKFAKDAKDAEALLSRLQFKAQPAPAQPLTDEQIKALWESSTGQKLPNMGSSIWQLLAVARAIEAAHGITETKGGA